MSKFSPNSKISKKTQLSSLNMVSKKSKLSAVFLRNIIGKKLEDLRLTKYFICILKNVYKSKITTMLFAEFHEMVYLIKINIIQISTPNRKKKPLLSENILASCDFKYYLNSNKKEKKFNKQASNESTDYKLNRMWEIFGKKSQKLDFVFFCHRCYEKKKTI